MSNISMVEAKLPPGFRFHPRDDELVCDYLIKKVTHTDSLPMIEVDLNKCEPWEIPASACVGGKEWYFYSERDRKYATGLRTNRATSSGYWKATGKDRAVLRKGTLVGMRKTLVFYQGRAPKGRKSDWVMHEFRLEGPLSPPKVKEDWVLCRVLYKDKETITVQSSTESCTYNDQKSLSALPALTDSYISFDQTQSNVYNNYHDQQVSCFSIFSQNQTNPSLSHTFAHQIESNNNSMSTTTKGTIGFGGLAMNNSTINPSYLDPLACDKKILKAVLDQITKVESNNTSMKESPSFGEGSSESFLSEVGMPNMWSAHY